MILRLFCYQMARRSGALQPSAPRHALLLVFLACFQGLTRADLAACQSELSVYMDQFTDMESALGIVTDPNFATSVCGACGMGDLDKLYADAAPIMETAGCNQTSVDDIIELMKSVVQFACSKNSDDETCAVSMNTAFEAIGIDLDELVTTGEFDTGSIDYSNACGALSGMEVSVVNSWPMFYGQHAAL
ncbi:hypothetical protein CYMTET_42985 [Cymbomonas tetramitiformis]|uniref:Uncharacterized protein n=1 Tax=Cymbomonas tetramitiformis TaxID=36881 RepID=A0AAE0F0Z2_9CHLO|nr:hypothetical protein CYMTET_42985 [Cymbomonas tetramitiformis]